MRRLLLEHRGQVKWYVFEAPGRSAPHDRCMAASVQRAAPSRVPRRSVPASVLDGKIPVTVYIQMVLKRTRRLHSVPKTIGSCGSRRDSRTGSWCSAITRTSATRPRTTLRRSARDRCGGTILRSESRGRWTRPFPWAVSTRDAAAPALVNARSESLPAASTRAAKPSSAGRW